MQVQDLRSSISNLSAIQKQVVASALASLFVGLGSLLAVYILLEGQSKRQAYDDIERDMRVAWELVNRYGENFQIKGDLLYIDDTLLVGRLDITDRVTDLVGGTATIFQGDLRVATSIRLENGKRATGTRLERNQAHKSIFELKQPFRGYVDILGVSYVTAYDPIFDAQNNVIGILYVGRETERYFAPIHSVEISIALIALFSTAFGALVTFFSNKRLISKTQKDSLTEVLNRRTGEELLNSSYKESVEHKKHLSIAFVDLDDFKEVNDSFGHSQGDKILTEIAKLLQRIIRNTDSVVRWGGDEFLVILENTNSAEAVNILKRLVKEVELLPVNPDGSHQTVSIGIASIGDDNEYVDLEDLVTAADYWMYQSKRDGKNQISPKAEASGIL